MTAVVSQFGRKDSKHQTCVIQFYSLFLVGKISFYCLRETQNHWI